MSVALFQVECAACRREVRVSPDIFMKNDWGPLMKNTSLGIFYHDHCAGRSDLPVMHVECPSCGEPVPVQLAIMNLHRNSTLTENAARTNGMEEFDENGRIVQPSNVIPMDMFSSLKHV